MLMAYNDVLMDLLSRFYDSCLDERLSTVGRY